MWRRPLKKALSRERLVENLLDERVATNEQPKRVSFGDDRERASGFLARLVLRHLSARLHPERTLIRRALAMRMKGDNPC